MAKRSQNRDSGASLLLTRDWLWSLVLFLAVVLAYIPVWWCGYIWDDDTLVTTNPVIVGPLGLKEIWTTAAADICPLTLSTFWLEHALWGLNPLGYHLVNVIMHAASAVILWRILRALSVPGAWLGAALWALHPVQVESVAWIVEMKNTESCLFFLLSILFFIKWVVAKDPSEPARPNWNYPLTLLFAALAMASKSSTVILPIVLCLCAWWLERRLSLFVVVRTFPVFLMALASGIASLWTQKIGGSNDAQWLRSWPDRLVTAGDAVWFYLGKLIWPHPLISVYPRWQIDSSNWLSWLPLIAVIALLVILWLKRDAWARPWFFVFAYFVVALLPVLGLANLFFQRFSFVADHFQYLASIAPLALAGAGMVRLGDLVFPRKKELQAFLASTLLLTLGIVTWQRATIYEDDVTLWTDSLQKNPDAWGGHNSLGMALAQSGRVDEGIAHLREAVRLNPEFYEAQNNLGSALVETGQLDEAIIHLQAAITLNPDFADAQSNLGNALFRKGQLDEALPHLRKAIALKPNFAEAHYNLGIVFGQKKQLDDAATQFQIALEINPNFAEAHNCLGIALAHSGHLDDAIAQFRAALQAKPDYPDAQTNLAKIQDLQRQKQK